MDESWVQTALTGAGVALSGSIAALFRYVVTQTKKNTDRLEAKLDECEVKHESTQTELKELTFQVGEMKGYQKGIEDLAKQVLEVVGKRGD